MRDIKEISAKCWGGHASEGWILFRSYQEQLLQSRPRWQSFFQAQETSCKKGWSQPWFSCCWTAVNRRNWTVDMSGTTTKACGCAPEGRYASELELQFLQAMLCKLVHVRQVVLLCIVANYFELQGTISGSDTVQHHCLKLPWTP